MVKNISISSYSDQSNSSNLNNSVSYMYSFCLLTIKYKKSSLSNDSVWHTKTVPFQTIHFSISTQFKCQKSPISSNSVWHKYTVQFYLTHRLNPIWCYYFGNEGVLRSPQMSGITGTSPLDCLESYQDTRWCSLTPL